MMEWLTIVLLCTTITAILIPTIVDGNNSITIDTALTKYLEQALKDDNLVIAFKHIKPKRKLLAPPEKLLEAVFHNTNEKFSIAIDRHKKKVIIGTIEDGRPRSQHFTVDILEDDTYLKSMLLAINQTQPGAKITLYIDCVSYGMVATPKTLREMYFNNSSVEDSEMETGSPKCSLVMTNAINTESSDYGNGDKQTYIISTNTIKQYYTKS